MSCALRTGYGQAPGAVTLGDIDLAELVRENIDEFMEWVQAGDPGALVSFAEEHRYLWEG